MKPPAALFKKKSKKVNQKLINTFVRWLRKRKDVKKNIKKEQGKSILELICFTFYWVSKIIPVLGYAFLFCVVCFLFMLC